MRQTTAVLLFGPIGVTLAWLLLSCLWALLMQGGTISHRTRIWIRNGGWIMFVASYLVVVIDFLVEHKL
jgi:hypothetical protein